MERKELEGIINEAIDNIRENDSYLIKNDVHEQTISAMLACYLREKLLNNGWNVDVEYNRDGEDIKLLNEIRKIK